MNRKRLMFAVRIAVSTAFALCTAVTQAQADEKFAGQVYDIDYLGGGGQKWTQVLLQAPPGNANLIAITKSDQLQRILETSLLNASEARVTYGAGQLPEIQTAVLRDEVNCTEKGCVQEVGCSVVTRTCSAKILGEILEVNMKDVRTLGILLTAMTKKMAVEYLMVDNQNFIVRVKINVP